MTKQKISRYIWVICSLMMAIAAWGQQPESPTAQPRTRGIQYQRELDSLQLILANKPLKWVEGFSVSGDLLGLIMHRMANYGQLEGAIRLNMKEKYFPTVEAGLGYSDHVDEETELHFKTNSPYVRIGADYNFARDLRSGNRIYAGVRYGMTKIKFDLEGNELIDPVWEDRYPFQFRDLSSNVSWAELLFGLEAKIWGRFHIGWTARYRMRLHQEQSKVGQSWYVPGYGKNDTHNFGGTFNLIFDL
ncbi:MAG: hypothetical protein IJ244_01810 [Bacteroidaceae bacterium]|nr:hypothetical protein [Bacteroidaceae bacterium]